MMLETVMDLVGLDAKECVITGDRLYTVVLTDETTAEALADEPASNKPTYGLERIDQLVLPHLWEKFGWTEDDE
jgi:hypothetical protein